MALSLERLVALPAVWLLVVLLLLLFRRRVLAWAERRVASSASAGDRRAVALLAKVYVPTGLLVAAYLSVQVLPLHPQWEDRAERWLGVLAALVGIALAWRGFSLLVTYWAETNPNAGTLVPPVQLIGRITFVVIGLALIFSALGYPVIKLWTALGIGSVAIALALQETLTNTLAGFQLMMDQPIRIGDYIRLDTSEEGRVIQIGWRSTRLRTLANNVLVIPNSKLSRASITNFSLPDPRFSLSIPVTVPYSADARRVRAALEEVARQAAGELEGMLADPPPHVTLIPGFADHAMRFSVNCQVREFAAQFSVQDELRYRVLERLQREQIALGVPPAAPPREPESPGDGRKP